MSIFWRKGMQWLILGLSLTSGFGHAVEYQDLDLIEEKITTDIRTRINPNDVSRYQIEVQSLDNRLRLARCDSELVTKISPQAQLIGRQSVEVRCKGNRPWKIYLQVTIFVEAEVPVLKQPLAIGALISNNDIEIASIQLGLDNRPIIKNAEQLIGMKVKRHISAGTPILISQVEARNLVHRGQQVGLEYKLNGLTVRMAGRSNEDGAEGDWIKIVNLNSGKTVEGRVNANGNVSVQN